MQSFSEYVRNQNIVASSINSTRILNHLIESISNSTLDSNSLVFTIGNGGSSSTAEHFSADLAQIETRTGRAVRSFCLNSQIALSSAFANDFEYSTVIEKQLSPFKNSNYILVAFSASGNSSNILNAIQISLAAHKDVYCFVGFDGGEVIKFKGVNLVFFPDSNKDYGIVENLHLTAAHYVVDCLVEKFNGK